MSRRGTRLPDAPLDRDEAEMHLHESDPDESEEEGEDIVGENMNADYVEKPALDTYDESQFDDAQYPAMTADQRRAAEREIDRQQRRERQYIERIRGRQTGLFGRRRPSALDSEDSEPLSLDHPGLLSAASLLSLPSEARRELTGSQIPSSELVGEEGSEGSMVEGGFRTEAVEPRFDLETIQNPIEAFNEPAPRKELERQFREFLETFIPGDQKKEYEEKVKMNEQSTIEPPRPVYQQVIQECIRNNNRSFEVDYRHIREYSPVIDSFLVFAPKTILAIFDKVARDVVLAKDPFYEHVTNVINVRISNLFPILPLTQFRHNHLNTFIRTTGVVTRRSAVFSQTTEARYVCQNCGTVIGPFAVREKTPIKIKLCPNCNSRGPFTLSNEETVFRNYQKITLQEAPNALEPGRLPRHKEVVLVNDLIDCCKPGEEIEVTGTYLHQYDVVLNKQYGFPVFTTQIEANHIKLCNRRNDGLDGSNLTVEEKQRMESLSKEPDIINRIVRSFAPAIYGHEDVKRALVLSMVGGMRTELPGHTIRGDINVLVLGDPATAKSQLLKYVEHTADRVVRTTGRGASAVGLTAAVRRDPSTGEWTLEGGAMVLANDGICVIDEFDKMNDKDRTSIHEAMEQQTISISKAGIVAVLSARCAVIAAANPIHSRYDTTQTFLANVDLSEPILSRFDLLCVVKDTIDDEADRRMARFIMKSHILAHPEFDEKDLQQIPHLNSDPDLVMGDDSNGQVLINALVSSGSGSSFRPLSPDVLRTYIRYARSMRVDPSSLPTDKLTQLYTELRAASNNCGGTSVSPRYLEALLRVTQAYAKLHLHTTVTEEDVQLAIRTVLESFIMSQRYRAKDALRKQFAKYMTYKKEKFVLLRELLKRMESETQQYTIFRISERLRAQGVDDADKQIYLRREFEKMGGSVTVEIDTERFLERARKESIEQSVVEAFLQSEMFRRTGFERKSAVGGQSVLVKVGVKLTNV